MQAGTVSLQHFCDYRLPVLPAYANLRTKGLAPGIFVRHHCPLPDLDANGFKLRLFTQNPSLEVLFSKLACYTGF